MKKGTKLRARKKPHVVPAARLKRFFRVFNDMKVHLEWCGFGDRFEREVARENKLEERIDEVYEEFKKEIKKL